MVYHPSSGCESRAELISRPTHVELSEAAGPEKLDPEEQNNIDVYHRVIPSVVNITSKTMAYDFFYGPVPEEGQGRASSSIRKDTSSPTITWWAMPRSWK